MRFCYSWRCGNHVRGELISFIHWGRWLWSILPRGQRRYSNLLDRWWANFFGCFRWEFDIGPDIVLCSSGITWPALGIGQMGFFARTPSVTNLSFLDAPNPLTGHSYLLHTPCALVHTTGLTFVQRSRYFPPIVWTACLLVSVTLCPGVWSTGLHLHKVLRGHPSYILRTQSGQMDGRDVYGVIFFIFFFHFFSFF